MCGKENNRGKWTAMLKCKCPVCMKGNMFKSRATDLRYFNELKTNCDVCGFRFMPEPGFYQISMFFTYAVGVALFIFFGILAYLLFDDPDLWVYYAFVFVPAIVTAPWNVRYSKVVMLYVFGGVWNKNVDGEN
jgi:uncharacterized protein (DUF983 family)